MSGGITVRPDHPANAWRQRGYEHGFAKVPPRPPEGEEERRAYMQGHRRGVEAREKVQAA